MTFYFPTLEFTATWCQSIKVEYHSNQNPLKNSEKIAYVGQGLIYPIMEINTLSC